MFRDMTRNDEGRDEAVVRDAVRDVVILVTRDGEPEWGATGT